MRLYNTLTRTVEEFTTRDEGRVGIYLCGPTVQNVPHFGHARAALVPDVLRRWLTYRGYDVFFVRNVTDVDDKIIDRAIQEQRPPAAVAEHYTRIYDREMARLGILPPDVAPRATGHIIEMIALIERLVEVGAAYEAGGDVFFSVRKFDGYGRLSGRNVDELRAGARIESTERKRDPLDFALWKAAKPGEPSWTSPWGRGRPGWHIECSAMASKYLGAAFDIHAGGLDLVFPHHENEIAQSEAASGRPFARYWLHNGMVTLGEEKMSKSVGNVIGLTEALERFGSDVLRLFLLSAHYRSPVDFNETQLADARAGYDRWAAFVRATEGLPAAEEDAEAAKTRQRFIDAMDDDLSTPAAQAALFDLVTEGNRALERGDREAAASARAVLMELAAVLGFDLGRAGDAGADSLIAPLVQEILRLRQEARERNDFTAADAIRARLSEIGIVVEDSPQGARWHVGAAE